MAANRCLAVTRAGTRCRVQARPGSRYCPFHDADCAAAMTAGRRKGGSTPDRRRSHRRTAAAGAALLYRLIATALDTPGPADTARLQFLAELAPVLLEALDRSAALARPSTLGASFAAKGGTGDSTGNGQASHARQQA